MEHVREAGSSVIELLVVVVIAGLCMPLPAVSLANAMRPVGTRRAAQGWQTMGARAQIAALWKGGAVQLEAADGQVRLTPVDGAAGPSEAVTVPQAPSTNFNRWRTGEGVTVTFSGPFGAPDGAGSVFYGEETWGSRVVVRAESGLTRRAEP